MSVRPFRERTDKNIRTTQPVARKVKNNMRVIEPFVGRKKSDWCHLCGKRNDTHFVEFTVPKNAEHSTTDASRGYFRICSGCVNGFRSCLVEASREKTSTKQQSEVD